MAKKKTTAVLRTPKQVQKECQDYLKSALSEIQYQCQNALTKYKTTLSQTKQAIKLDKTNLKTLEGKLAAAKATLAKKRTKAAETALKKMMVKLEETKQHLQKASKCLDKLTQNIDSLGAYKVKAKARDVAVKTFEKDYKVPMKSSPKANQSTALIEARLRHGDTAPDFTSVLEDNKAITLAQFKGKNVVLYFYPKDSTPGCTQEAKDFTGMAEQFTAKNTVILGVSRDSMTSHNKFAEKYGIPYTLLADTNEAICNAYGVIKNKNMYGKKVRGIERSTFLIDQQGSIAALWRGVKVPEHVETVLAKIN